MEKCVMIVSMHALVFAVSDVLLHVNIPLHFYLMIPSNIAMKAALKHRDLGQWRPAAVR